jgi:alpha-beta hydrolase superfamily lysophospholipase
MQPESFRMGLERLLLELPRPSKVKTPILVLAAENDKVFSVAEQCATARCYGTEAEIFPDVAHDMMLEPGWQNVAGRILDWLKDRDL